MPTARLDVSRVTIGLLNARMLREILSTVISLLVSTLLLPLLGCNLPSIIMRNLSCVHSFGRAGLLSLTGFAGGSGLGLRSGGLR